jgi:hypothetical protein
MAHIITVEYLKSLPLPIKDAQWDAIDPTFLEEVVDAAGDFLESYLDRCVHHKRYQERLRGDNRYTLILNNYPITALHSIREVDEINGHVIRAPSEFIIHEKSGLIEWKDKVHNYFWTGRVYLVDYSSGFVNIPPALKYATALQAYEMLQPVLRGSRDMGPVDLVPASSEKFVELTEPYRRKRIA